MTGKNPSPGRLSGRGLPQLDPRREQLPYRAPLVGGPVAAVVYAYTVTNTGDAALHDVAVTDDLVARVICDTTTLAAGANTATATIQANGGKDDNCRKQRGGYGKTS
ncbi:hypothetical protein [Streptomyces murinus]